MPAALNESPRLPIVWTLTSHWSTRSERRRTRWPQWCWSATSAAEVPLSSTIWQILVARFARRLKNWLKRELPKSLLLLHTACYPARPVRESRRPIWKHSQSPTPYRKRRTLRTVQRSNASTSVWYWQKRSDVPTTANRSPICSAISFRIRL